jgi:hypothetical protein
MDTLPPSLSSVFLVVCGLAFLGVSLRAHSTGELPAGANGLRAFRPRRDENPAAFYFFQLLYVGFGAWLVWYGVRIALGDAAPLPLR